MAISASTRVVWIVFLLAVGCFHRYAAMTWDAYDQLAIGTPVGEVTAKVGEPVAIRMKGSELQEYEYVERISMGDHYTVEHVYYIDVLHGIVVGKRMKSCRSPGYDVLFDGDLNFSQ